MIQGVPLFLLKKVSQKHPCQLHDKIQSVLYEHQMVPHDFLLSPRTLFNTVLDLPSLTHCA